MIYRKIKKCITFRGYDTFLIRDLNGERSNVDAKN